MLFKPTYRMKSLKSLLFLSGFYSTLVDKPESKVDQVACKNMDMGQSFMIKEKAMNNLKLLEVSESSQVTQVVKEVSKFPIEIAVFEKH